jgi:ribonuclease HI
MVSLVGAIDEFKPTLVWILLGAKAQELEPYIKRGTVLKWGHPSPLNPYNQTECPQSFKYCPCFAQAEQLITARGEAFNWRLEPLAKTHVAVPTEIAPIAVPAVLPIVAEITPTQPPGEQQTKPLYIFTDGGCWGNGKETARGAWAWILTDLTDVIASDSGLLVGKATNQRAELTAIIMALEANPSKRLTIISDSEYSILTFTKWHKSWSAKRWTTVANVDLIRRGLAVVDETVHTFKHVRGHKAKPAAGTQAYWEWYYNDRVDKMCSKLLDS